MLCYPTIIPYTAKHLRGNFQGFHGLSLKLESFPYSLVDQQCKSKTMLQQKFTVNKHFSLIMGKFFLHRCFPVYNTD